MHEAGVVADEQGRAPQDGGGGQEIGPADEIDDPCRRQRRNQRHRLRPLVCRRQDRDPGRRKRRVGGGQTLRQLGKALGAPLLAAPIGGGADRQDRAAGRHERLGGAVVGGRRPDDRAWRRVETEQPAELANPMLRRIALADDKAPAGPEEPDQCRAAQIHDDVPAPAGGARVERRPMGGPALLMHGDQPFEPRDGRKQRRRRRAGGDRQPGRGKARDQMGQKTGRQHGVANAGRGHEQDAH